jgi:hypothetical protein
MKNSQYVTLEWLPHQLYIQEVMGSNLGPDSSYPDMFCDFPQSSLTNAKVEDTLNKVNNTSLCLFIKCYILNAI